MALIKSLLVVTLAFPTTIIAAENSTERSSIVTCLQSENITNAAIKTNSCFTELINAKINKIQNNTAQNTSCQSFEDFNKTYNAFFNDAITCVDEVLRANISSSKRYFLDLIEHSVKNDKLAEFQKNGGFSCVDQFRNNITECVTQYSGVIPNVNISQSWARRGAFIFGITASNSTSRIKNCTLEVLKLKCNQSSIDYVEGLFDYALQNFKIINRRKGHGISVPRVSSTLSPAVYVPLVLLAILIVIVIALVVKKRNIACKKA